VIVTPPYVSKGQGSASYVRACRFIHNVAEGVVVAVPILAGTGDRRTAIVITALSGLSEPVGALMGVWCMKTWFSSWMEATIGFILCVVGRDYDCSLNDGAVTTGETVPFRLRTNTAGLLSGMLHYWGHSLLPLRAASMPVDRIFSVISPPLYVAKSATWPNGYGLM
jgi:hypothetical protein